MSLLPVSAIQVVDTGYNINNSLRLRANANAELTRTPTTSSNRTTWTFSAWIKRGALVDGQSFFGVTTSGSDNTQLRFSEGGGFLNLRNEVGGSALIDIFTVDRLFRDPSAWYHIIIVFDSTNATAANRCVMYVNGERQTLSTNPSGDIALNETTYINSTVLHSIGNSAQNSTVAFDGYLAEVHFVDGQALTQTSFGETNPITGVWQPKAYTGTYGTNGFYLKFADASAATAAAIGKDSSGNGNNWTPTGVSVTAGATYDAMTDSPTLTSATVANYCTLNPLDNNAITITNANLNATSTTGADQACRSTIWLTTGKWYWEVTRVAESITTDGNTVGVANASQLLTAGNVFNTSTNIWGMSLATGNKHGNAGSVAYGSTIAVGSVVGIAYDADAQKIWFRNASGYFASGDPVAGTNAAFTNTTGTTGVSPYVYKGATGSTIDYAHNFGQRAFSYTPPTGYNRLNTFNLPTSTVVKGNSFMDATTYTGTGASLSVTNAASFNPNLVWIKGRSGATDSALYDSVRLATRELVSSSTGIQTIQAQGLTAFNSNGFTVGTLAKLNTNAATYVAWQWRASTTPGFEIINYGGVGVNTSIGHGLGVAPAMMIVKRMTGSAGAWQVYHRSIPATNVLVLNTTAVSTSATTVWNSTAPTSTEFYLGTSGNVNASGSDYIAYLWAAIPGFSAFGSYTGNGSTDGPFIYLGFRPKFVMYKRTNSTTSANWWTQDSSRNTFNPTGLNLQANTNLAETNNSPSLDFLANGYKIRTSLDGTNANASTYIYMAFAENPFKNSLAR